MRETLTISALARRAGVSSKTLRYWERRGLHIYPEIKRDRLNPG
jgi:DNA-binding transcriptional MerR regulator